MSDNQPGLVTAHAQYAKEAAVESIGNLTGSKEWQDSGKAGQEQAKANMHQASNISSDASTRAPTESLAREGGLEQKLGDLAGCTGMQEQGEAKVEQAKK